MSELKYVRSKFFSIADGQHGSWWQFTSVDLDGDMRMMEVILSLVAMEEKGEDMKKPSLAFSLDSDGWGFFATLAALILHDFVHGQAHSPCCLCFTLNSVQQLEVKNFQSKRYR
ncbi:hypothetical protein V6N13_105896 [Hibiscus sabdariffa]